MIEGSLADECARKMARIAVLEARLKEAEELLIAVHTLLLKVSYAKCIPPPIARYALRLDLQVFVFLRRIK